MSSMEEIQRAVRQLSRFEREALAEWILNAGDFGDRVAEPVPAYGAASGHALLSAEDYLQLEEESPIRHEYIAGRVFAMSGVKPRHNAIACNLIVSLHGHLKAGPCRAYSTDVKVRLRVDDDDIFYYPDLFVVCGPHDLDSPYLTRPCLVVEILSPSTERYDRYEKARNYREIPSLDEYVLISQSKPEVTIHRRGDQWVPRVLNARESVVEFQSIQLQLSLRQIYEGVC